MSWYEREELITSFLSGMYESGYNFGPDFVSGFASALALCLMHEKQGLPDPEYWAQQYPDICDLVSYWVQVGIALYQKSKLATCGVN